MKHRNLRKSKLKKEIDIKNRNLKILKFKKLKFKKMKILKLRNSKDIKAWIMFLYITKYCTVSRMEMWKNSTRVCIRVLFKYSPNSWMIFKYSWLLCTQKSIRYPKTNRFHIIFFSVFTIIDKINIFLKAYSLLTSPFQENETSSKSSGSVISLS